MGKEKIELDDVGRANRLGRRLELIIVAILTISYIVQGTKDGIAPVSLAIIFATLWIPVIIAFFVYRKNPNSGLIKHLIGLGYGLFYIAVCVISEQQLVFTYAFPMLLVVSIYGDRKFSITVGISVLIIAIVHAVIFTIQVIAGTAGMEPAAAEAAKAMAIGAMEIELAASAFITIYTIVANTYIIKIMDRNVKRAADANEKTEIMLNNVMEVSGELANEVDAVTEKMHELASSSEETMLAMTEVTHGTTDTADSVQNQLIKTEEIQRQIAKVSETTQSITGSVEDSVAAIEEGRKNIENLMKQAEISENAGRGAIEEVETLKQYTSQMESIISLIQNVASQTSLLSLNASIEAARAGEAGRGFAVVASEISNLASQTETATENINTLIDNVTREMNEVAKAITSLVESNMIQTESAHVTAGSFEKIAGSAGNIRENSDVLTGIVGSLDAANQEIIENIQTISAITEEVSAHSTTTCEKTEQTQMIVGEVQQAMQEMTENAEKLKRL